jgi:transcriptional regulator with XRE-family HTH domain
VTLGKRVEAALEARGKTQQGFGTEHGFPRGQINRIVNGRRANVTPETLIQLADGLDVSLLWLASGRGAMDPCLAAAIEFARLDGVPQSVIALVVRDLDREAPHSQTPSQWLERIRKARVEARVKVEPVKPAGKPKEPKLPRWSVISLPMDPGTFSMRLQMAMKHRGLDKEGLSRETARLGHRVHLGDINLLETGGYIASGGDEKVANISRALAIDPDWLGRPEGAPKRENKKQPEMPAVKKAARKTSAA